MGRKPRQHKKLKKSSFSNKASHNAKRRADHRLNRSPAVKGPDVLKEKWDSKLTVRQNYAKLGLAANLRIHDAGGSETLASNRAPLDPQSSRHGGSALPTELKRGTGRIVRDEAGNVVEVVLDDEPEVEKTPWGEALNVEMDEGQSEHDDVEKGPERSGGGGAGVVSSRTEPGGDEVMQALQKLSKRAAEPVPRHTAWGKLSWLVELVDRHGDDVEAMARDARLNVWQKTRSEIQRAIKQAGGFEALRGTA